ncbi:MAG: hypothetical protein WEB58_12785 [Planctomycetaceae bacterium]
MTKSYQLVFVSDVRFRDVEKALENAHIAATAVFERKQLKRETMAVVDKSNKSLIFQIDTPLRRDLCNLVLAFIDHRFSRDQYQIVRLKEKKDRDKEAVTP